MPFVSLSDSDTLTTVANLLALLFWKVACCAGSPQVSVRQGANRTGLEQVFLARTCRWQALPSCLDFFTLVPFPMNREVGIPVILLTATHFRILTRAECDRCWEGDLIDQYEISDAKASIEMISETDNSWQA